MQKEKSIEGKKAIPPKRGTTPLWIFRLSMASNSFFRKAISKICGIIIPARKSDIKNDIRSLNIQCSIDTVMHLPLISHLLKVCIKSNCKFNPFYLNFQILDPVRSPYHIFITLTVQKSLSLRNCLEKSIPVFKIFCAMRSKLGIRFTILVKFAFSMYTYP